DLQHRNPPDPPKPHMQFFEKEGYRFSIEKGPKWLSIDPDTGLLSGKPARGDDGRHEVVIRAKRTWPFEVDAKKYGKAWDKSDDKYQAKHEQAFVITVKE